MIVYANGVMAADRRVCGGGLDREAVKLCAVVDEPRLVVLAGFEIPYGQIPQAAFDRACLAIEAASHAAISAGTEDVAEALLDVELAGLPEGTQGLVLVLVRTGDEELGERDDEPVRLGSHSRTLLRYSDGGMHLGDLGGDAVGAGASEGKTALVMAEALGACGDDAAPMAIAAAAQAVPALCSALVDVGTGPEWSR